jgi:hypothetical protein
MVLAGWCLVLLAAVPNAATEEEPTVDTGPKLEALNFDVGAKEESQLGTELVGSPIAGAISTNFVLEPAVVLEERSRTGEFLLAYDPWLLYSPSVPDQILALHRFRFQVLQQTSRTAGLTLNGSVWFGDQSYSPVVNLGLPPGSSTPTGPGLQPPAFPGQLPVVSTLKTFQSSVRAGFYMLTSSQVRLEFNAGFTWAQGATAAARLELPIQRGPFVEARAYFTVSPRDVLIPIFRSALLVFGPVFVPAGGLNPDLATALVPHFETGLNIWTNEVELQWQRQLSRDLVIGLGGGVGIVNFSAFNQVLVPPVELVWIPSVAVPSELNLYPLAAASLRYQAPLEHQSLSIAAAVAIRPTVNPFNATVYETLGASAVVIWGMAPDWRLEVTGGAAAANNPKERDVEGGIRLSWQPIPNFVLAAGARVANTEYFLPTVLNGFNWMVFLSVAGATKPIGATSYLQ